MTANIAYEAMMFARAAHAEQRRKYTGNPYADHLAEVAGLVATVAHDISPFSIQVPIAVAWLHDCVEDQGVTTETLERRFGVDVAAGVALLSDMEAGHEAAHHTGERGRAVHVSLHVGSVHVVQDATSRRDRVAHRANEEGMWLVSPSQGCSEAGRARAWH